MDSKNGTNNQESLGKINKGSLASKIMTAFLGKSEVLPKTIIATKKQTPLDFVDVADIKSNDTIHAKARYLYWACFRGHVNLIKHILENDKISPFARIYEGRSPMMASLIGKHANFKNQNLGNQNLSNTEA